MRFLIIILYLMPLVTQAQITQRKSTTTFQTSLASQNRPFLNNPVFHSNKILDTIYYPDKTIKAVGFYAIDRNGKKTYYRTGLWREFYNNGELKSVGNYQFQIVFSCCGGTLCEQICLYRVGDWTYYYDSGSVQAKGIYKVEKTNANTNVENQFMYRSVITEKWLLYDADGQTAKDRHKIISDLEKPAL